MSWAVLAALLCQPVTFDPVAGWAYASARGSRAMVILRDGVEVFAAAEPGFSVNTPHMLASGTKTFSAAAIALLAQDRKMNIDEKMSVALPEWAAIRGKRDITYRLLLSLSSGLETSTSGESTSCPPESTLLATPLLTDPGTDFEYGPRAFNLFSLAAERKLGGQKLHAYLESRLFAPLGLTVSWSNVNSEGRVQFGGGARMSGRDWARFGEWIRTGGTRRRPVGDLGTLRALSTPWGPAPLYGLAGWLSAEPSTSTGAGVPSTFPGFYMAAGLGKQVMVILPTERMVLVRVGRLSGSAGSFSTDDWLTAILGRS